MQKENILNQAIAQAVARAQGASVASFKERLNANSISLILNTRACDKLINANLLPQPEEGRKLRQFTLRVDTRAQANALAKELATLDIKRA